MEIEESDKSTAWGMQLTSTFSMFERHCWAKVSSKFQAMAVCLIAVPVWKEHWTEADLTASCAECCEPLTSKA